MATGDYLIQPMHYNNQQARENLLAKMPWLFDDSQSKVLSFVNLCIYPHKFELLWHTLRTQERITEASYNAVKGVICALMVMNNRMHKEKDISVDAYVIDFIKIIRSCTDDNPVKFLLSMRAYMVRFMFIVGLRVAFGVDWRELVYQVLELKNKPQNRSYHSLFTNLYIRTLLHAYICWKNYREPHDPDYESGTNDILTLLENYSKLKKNLGYESTLKLFEALQSGLPSWSVDSRRKAAWAIDSAQDGFSMINRQFTDWKYKQVQG